MESQSKDINSLSMYVLPKTSYKQLPKIDLCGFTQESGDREKQIESNSFWNKSFISKPFNKL